MHLVRPRCFRPPPLTQPPHPPHPSCPALLFGALLSLTLTRKLGARPWKELAPQCGLIVLFMAELWTLILPN